MDRLALLCFLVFPAALTANQASGELKQWHNVTITFDGPKVCEKSNPNPFLHYRLNVTFTHGGKHQTVPGYFAADGDAANTSAECGNKWRAQFVPDRTGRWTYRASFRKGPDVAVRLDPDAGAPDSFDGAAGAFEIAPSDKTGRDHRAKGMLQYVGEHYLRYAGSGEYFIQAGAQSPENFLAYDEFDNTEDHGGPTNRLQDGLHRYEPHRKDWREGDPTWKSGKGKGIIGALNYFAGKGMNTFYTLTMNVEGDGREIYPWINYSHRTRYDVSKLAQWEMVFSHMDRLGLQVQLITQEEENEELLGKLTTERKLYYRELVARFAHHHGIIWDLDEEMDRWDYFTTQDIQDMCAYLKAIDPYRHPIQYVQWKAELMSDDRTYGRLLGFPHFDGTALQHDVGNSHAQTMLWRDRSARAGHKWLVGIIEINPNSTGVVPDADNYWHDAIRKQAIWGNLMAGGAGVLHFFGYKYPNSDLDCEDWRSRDHLWELMRHAHEFFTRYLPFHEMDHHDELTPAPGDFVYAKPGDVYAIYLPEGGGAELDLRGVEGTFEVRWYDPRSGDELRDGTLRTIAGGALRSIGAPPDEPAKDWAVLVRRLPLADAGGSAEATHYRAATEVFRAATVRERSSASPALRITARRVQILAGGEVIAESPAEGLWSIACDWQDRWPAAWGHAHPAAVATAGKWTILHGELNACGGAWLMEDAYRPAGNTIEGRRRFHWTGTGVAPKVTLSVRFQARADRWDVLLPGILYYGNPSGAKSGRVPVFIGRPGEEALFEEHRYPMPFAYAELERSSANWGAALHSVPSPAPYANLADQWWSLGVAARKEGAELLLLSGPCASNGNRSVVKSQQKGFTPYDDAYLNVPPGTVIEKRFFVEAFPVEDAGSGFSRAVRTAMEISPPYSLDRLPEFAEIVRAKYRYAKSRWLEADGSAGFRKYADEKRTSFVMGWTGQAEAPGYALQALAEGLGDPQAVPMAQKSLDFLSTAEFYERGFRNWYDYKAKKWSGDELLCQGQAMLAFARAIGAGRQGKMSTARWEAFLRKAADLHAGRVLAEAWRPISTAEATFIAPLLESSELFGAPLHKQAALKAAAHYAARHLSMREPYWGGTLDARSEDKEAAALAFQAFLALYERTREAEHLRWARHACDVLLTYAFIWDADLPPGRLRDHGFRTRGWTVVSPQNQHLDVWGAIVAPDVYRLGQIDNREELKRLALVMYRSCGQLIDPYGSQGEQMHHTNYGQRVQPGHILRERGSYNEQWTVFWITAHFLTGAARFAELGVPIWR